MKDYNDREFQVGDWFKGVGWVPYGKVTKVTEDSVSYLPDGDKGSNEETLTLEEVKERGVCIEGYSIIRRRHLEGNVPDDFFTLSTAKENARLPQYLGISYYQQLIEDILDEAGKLPKRRKVHLETIDGYLEVAKKAMMDNEDEENFGGVLVEWFKENYKK